MKRLIVTADDFGLAKSVNEGIAMALREGIVTCVNLTPAGGAFRDAVRIAKELKIEEAGAHLALTEVRNDFPPHHTDLFIRILGKKADIDSAYGELKRQLEEALSTGIRITNLSSHEHIHMVPDILKTFIRLAKEYNIPFIRYPHGDRSVSCLDLPALYRSVILEIFSPGMKKAFDGSGIRYADHLAGFIDSGRLTEARLISIIESLKDGVTELVCHPGFLGPEVLEKYRFHINCEAELTALTSSRVRRLVDESGVRLTRFGEV